jgi:nitrous oxidase accessory protein NosD
MFIRRGFRNCVFIILFLVFTFITSVANAATPISTCTEINESGDYILTSNIINSSVPTSPPPLNPEGCINIKSSDVILEGQGYTIDGVNWPGAAGIYVNSTVPLTNVTVRNLTVSDWGFGIYYREVENSTDSISSISANSNLIGVQLYYSRNIAVRGNNLTGNGDGLDILWSSSNIISANNILNNTARGVYVESCGECSHDSFNNTITGNNISYNGEIGIFFDSQPWPLISNLVYNNYITANTLRNAVDNPWFNSTFKNNWNTSPRAGTNIIGGSIIGGNYWGDYLGSDTDEDGFGDTLLPYNSQGNITNGGDFLPLIGDTLPPIINISNLVNGSTINIFNDWIIGNVSDSASNVTEVNISLNSAFVGLYPINQSTGLFSVKMNYTPGVLNNVSISATDSAGNTGNIVIGITVRANSDTATINATAGEVVIINDTLNNTDLALEVVTNSNLTFQVNVTAGGNESLFGILSLENGSAYGLFDENESAIGKFVEITVSDNINSSSANISSAVLKLYIKSEDLDVDGDGIYNGTGDYNISTIKIYWYNSSGSTWHPLVKGSDYEVLGPYVFDNGVNETSTEVYLGFAFANISHFSVYGVSASVYGGGAVVVGSGAVVDGGDGSVPMLIEMQNGKSNIINLVASDVTYLGIVRQFNYLWHQFVDSSQTLRGPLSALGIHWAPIKYANKLNQILYPHNLTEQKGDVYSIAAEKAMSKYRSGAKRVLLSRGDLGVDSMAASAYAKILNIPILLTEPESLPEASTQALLTLGVDSVIVAGGPEAVSAGVEDTLPGALRIGGADRYETAVLFAEAILKEASSNVVVVTDGRSPEATSLIVAYYYNAPLIYVSGDEVPETTKAFLSHNKFKIVVTVGVSPSAGEKLNELVG